MGSIKLKQALLANKVSVQSKQTGEVSVWYRTPDGERQFVIVGGYKTVELAPKLTEARLLQWSNLEQLIKQRALKIITG